MADMNKFKRLVHYICAQSPNPSKLGATKLNKILWYSEQEAFLRLSEPISGARFVKRQFGPVPAAILPTIAELESEGALIVREAEIGGRSKREFFSMYDPDISDFKPQEVSIVNHVLNTICFHHTANSISEISHDEVWKLAQIGEDLPLYTVFSVPGELDENDVAWAHAEIATLQASAS